MRTVEQLAQHMRQVAETYIEERTLWRLACEYEGVDPLSQFVVFTEDNPYVRLHDRAFTKWRQAVAGG